jgi:ubiquinone/menaquinone biosynthesis C-methylase UbiE
LETAEHDAETIRTAVRERYAAAATATQVGIDVLFSARRVGPTGYVYGLDMTPEMLDLARRNQADAAWRTYGTIENVPLPDTSVDVIISNCVIKLSVDKRKVLAEAHRVLRPGGLFAVSDVVLLRPLSAQLTELMGLWTGCVTGALDEIDGAIANAFIRARR